MNIGYYAHHHGSGHCRQADKLAALLSVDDRSHITVFTSISAEAYTFNSIPESQVVRIAAEDELDTDTLKGRAGEYWQPNSLHYSPVGNSNIQKRAHQLLDNIHKLNIELMIIDVSVEVAILCRAASIPYLYVRLPGIRDDIPHVNAFAGSLAMIAPYPKSLDASVTPEWLPSKTLYLDFVNTSQLGILSYPEFISSLVSFSNNNHLYIELDERPIVTVIKGYGGHEDIDNKLPKLRELLPHTLIISLGPIHHNKRAYVDIAAEVNDVMPFIEHSDCLLMACGLNAISQVYSTDTPLVVLPDYRPHNEQHFTAQALINEGRAVDWDYFQQLVSLHGNNLFSDNALFKGQALQEAASEPSSSKTVVFETSIPEILSSNRLATDTVSSDRNLKASLALELMQSTKIYTSIHSWFHDWLLPRIDMQPD
ncbi:hypothetical protein [Psychrobacter sp.]|uniref:hypothetical protein n=1 Tax=Psychrobacter sp. TaxID=56811 RepID=UPI0025CFB6E4|nr:hypothetical protein [Psychrobacter sp.]